MTTGRINQVNIFNKKRQKLTQQSQTPARHMHPVTLKNTAQPNTNSTLLLSSVDSYSLLSLIERQKHDRNESSLYPAFPHTDCKMQSTRLPARTKKTNQIVLPHAEVSPRTQQYQTIQFHSTKLNKFPQRSNAQLSRPTNKRNVNWKNQLTKHISSNRTSSRYNA